MGGGWEGEWGRKGRERIQTLTGQPLDINN